MHQKAKSSHKILTRIRYFSYSIPIACIMTLLVGIIYGTCFILPDYNSNNAYAEGDNSDAGIATIADASASLTVGGGSSVNLASNTTPGNVAYAATNVSYSATDISSYNVKVSYANGSNSLKGLATNATTIGGANSKSPSATGNNAMSDNTWGYAWTDTSKTTESQYANLTYQTMPAYNSGATVASGTSSISNGSGRIVFAAKFGNEAITGRYQTNVLVSLAFTPKSITYTLTFDGNGGSNAPTVSSYTGPETNHTFTIPTGTPTRDKYDFLGWAESSTATTADSNYAPGKTITLTYASPTKTLYAVWKAKPQGLTFITVMQEMESDICAASNIGDSNTLTDSRDNKTYTIKKLSDEKCWMTQNLRTVNKTLTQSDSNTSGNFIVPASASWTDKSTTGNHAYYGNDTDYGAYYTWYTATAGTNASTYDICPKGWRLPTSGEFQALYDKGKSSRTTNGGKNGYWIGGSSASVSGAAFFPAAGYMNADNGLSSAVGSDGFYWSSTPAGSTTTYLRFNSSSILPLASFNRYFGLSVRCVAK